MRERIIKEKLKFGIRSGDVMGRWERGFLRRSDGVLRESREEREYGISD
jgi:hypothetical protein